MTPCCNTQAVVTRNEHVRVRLVVEVEPGQCHDDANTSLVNRNAGELKEKEEKEAEKNVTKIQDDVAMSTYNVKRILIAL